MPFYPSDHGKNSAVFLSLLNISPSWEVVFYYPAFLYFSCKIFLASAATCSHGKNYIRVILAACFTVLSSPAQTDQSAVLGNVLLHFSRSRVWGYACSLGGNTGKVYNWECLWEPRLSSPTVEKSTYSLWSSLLKPGSWEASSFNELLLLSCVLEGSFFGFCSEEVLI